MGAVTIATNMAGRGTDIQLGGNADMRIAAGAAAEEEREGARAEAHPPPRSRPSAQRVRERRRPATSSAPSGTRAGASTTSCAAAPAARAIPAARSSSLSLEDDLMRRFGSERMDGMLQRLGLKEGEAIIHPWINKALEKAQQKVEAHNFEIRKQLLKFDDVMNDQRKVVYEQRRELMEAEDVADTVRDMRHQVIEDLVAKHIPEKAYPEQWDIDAPARPTCQRILDLDLPLADWAKEEGIADQEIRERLLEGQRRADRRARSSATASRLMRMAEKTLLLQILDHLWKEHLLHLDHLRQGIHLRGYAPARPAQRVQARGLRPVRGAC